MSNQTATSQPTYAKAIVNRTLIEAPLETVWSILVKTDEPLPFFFHGVCDTQSGLHEGAKMRMLHKNKKYAMVVGEVLAFEPPYLYSHTFQMTHIDEPPCKVTYRLTEAEGGTAFELIIENAIEGSRRNSLAVERVGNRLPRRLLVQHFAGARIGRELVGVH